MATSDAREPRTVLERKIWERNQSLEEFAEDAERFARTFGEPGTLSERHLKRLVAGRKPDGSPVGRPRPATARLLERIFGLSVDELLSPPDTNHQPDDGEQELRQMLSAARRVNPDVLRLLRDQLTAVRRLDRQLGAVTAHDEVVTKIQQVTRLLSHSLAPGIREHLAVILAELGTLAGWQALDLGNVSESWHCYERAKGAAGESGQVAFEVHTAAEQAFVLLDLGETATAIELLEDTEKRAHRVMSRLLRSWLAAAHGEALAADGQRSGSLRAFDRAASLLPNDPSSEEDPYVALDSVHLARWRGHALVRVGEPEALETLMCALRQLDPTFTRAESGLHVDLATAFAAMGEHEQAQIHLSRARMLATGVGSCRQKRRITRLSISLAN